MPAAPVPLTVESARAAIDRVAEDAVLVATAGSNLLLREAVRRRLDLLRADLAGPAANALERLLVDRVVMGWLQVYAAEATFAQATGLTFAQSDSMQRRIDRAHRRLLGAAKALATVRRLALPAVMARVAVAVPELGHTR